MITVLFILLFFASFFSLPGSVEFSSMDQFGDPNVILKFSARALAGIFFYISFLTLLPKMRDAFRGSLLACWVFACWATVSLLPSAEKFYSFYRLVDLVIMLLAASVVCVRIDSLGNLRKYYYALLAALILLVAVPFAVYYIDPSIGGKLAYVAGERTYRLGGSIMRVAHVGGITAILTVVVVARLMIRRREKLTHLILLLGLCLYSMYLTGARGAVVAAIGGVAIVLLVSIVSRRWVRVGLVLVLVLCGIISIAGSPDLQLWFTRGQGIDQLMQANDRLALWEGIWAETTLRSFLVGHGYQMLSQEGRSIQAVGSRHLPYASAHNGYVHTFAGTGLVGAILLLLMFWLVFTRLFRSYRELRDTAPHDAQVYLELLVIVAVIAIHNLTDFDVGGNTNPIFLTFMLIAGLAVKRPVEILESSGIRPVLHHSWRLQMQGDPTDKRI